MSLFFFLAYNEETQSSCLVPVKRPISRTNNTEEKIQIAITALLEGPDEKEKAAGLSSVMPENASLLEVELKDNIVFLDFSKEIEQGGGTVLMMDRLAQIVYTATQFSSYGKVQMLINGKTIKYFSGEGITEVEEPMDRKEFNYTIKTITGG
ncbi:MAG: GerMN domain-containing protein [Candidatus Ratteibacteria bacterium]